MEIERYHPDDFSKGITPPPIIDTKETKPAIGQIDINNKYPSTPEMMKDILAFVKTPEHKRLLVESLSEELRSALKLLEYYQEGDYELLNKIQNQGAKVARLIVLGQSVLFDKGVLSVEGKQFYTKLWNLTHSEEHQKNINDKELIAYIMRLGNPYENAA